MSPVFAPGVKISSTPAARSGATSSTGMMPPPKTTMSLGAPFPQLLHHLREQRHVGAGVAREPDGVGVLLDRGLGDLLGRLVQAGVDHLEARVAQSARDDLGSPVVPVEPGFRHHDAMLARHRRRVYRGSGSPGLPCGTPLSEYRSMRTQETKYAKTADGVHIAYQVVGDGPVDVVFVMGWVTNVEAIWEEPDFARFLERLATFSRLILFDKRGVPRPLTAISPAGPTRACCCSTGF